MSSNTITDQNSHFRYTAEGGVARVPRVSWGAIFAGVAVALAMHVMLSPLGVGIGGAVVDPNSDSPPLTALATGSAVYVFAMQLIALLAGGYVAARLAGIPRKMSSVLHGAAVWAVSTIAILYVATTSAGALIGGSASLLSSTASQVSNAAEAVIPDNVDISAPEISMSDLPPDVQEALRQRDLTAQDMQREANEILRNVISKDEQERAVEAVGSAAKDVVNSPQDAASDINALVDKLVGEGAVLSEEDQNEAMTVLQNRLGISESEAQQMLDTWQQRAQAAVQEAEQALQQARKESVDALSTATSTLSQAGFMAFAASLLGLCAAGIGALLGTPKQLVGSDPGDHHPAA